MLELRRLSAFGADGEVSIINPAGEGQIMLRERSGFHIAEIASFGEKGDSALRQSGLELPGPGSAIRCGDVEILSAGPRRWLLITPGHYTLSGIESGGAVTDLTAARCIISLSGPQARGLLAKGCSVDLHPAAFPPGSAAATRIGHIAATIWRGDGDGFSVMASRSYARALWDWLLLAGEEFRR